MQGGIVYGSSVENGQLVPVLTSTQVFPSNAFVPYYQGRGAFTPTLPPPVTLGGSHDWAMTGIADGSSAALDPMNPGKSPVVWILAALLIGLLGLRHIHWKG